MPLSSLGGKTSGDANDVFAAQVTKSSYWTPEGGWSVLNGGGENLFDVVRKMLNCDVALHGELVCTCDERVCAALCCAVMQTWSLASFKGNPSLSNAGATSDPRQMARAREVNPFALPRTHTRTL